MRNLTMASFQLLERSLHGLPEALRSEAEAVLAGQKVVLRHFRSILDRGVTALRWC